MYNKTLLSASILLALNAPVHAENVKEMDKIVVSATKTEQQKKDISSSIEIVSADDMSKSIASDLKQALNNQPGVSAQGSGRFGLSGFNIRGIENSRIKMMIDDVQQPNSYNPGANEQRFYSNGIEIDTLQQIEINKSPSSVAYGSGALGGLVLLRTKNPSDFLVTDQDETRFGIKTSYASVDDEFKNTATVAARKGNFEGILIGTYASGHETKTHDSGSSVEGPDRGEANPADNDLQNIFAKGIYQVNEANKIGFTLEYYTKDYDEKELNYNGYSIPSMRPGQSSYDYQDSYNNDKNSRLRVGLSHDWLLQTVITDEINWSIDFQGAESISKNHDTTNFAGKRNRERKAKENSVQLNAKATKFLDLTDSFHQLTYGLNYISSDFDLDNTDYTIGSGVAKPGATGMPDAKQKQWGLFVQNQAHLLEDQWIITTGLRYDSFETTPSTDEAFSTHYDANKDNALTAKLGSVYHINENLSLFGQISQGFKAPTVYDLYYFYGRGAIIEANPDLKSEKSLSYEMGLRGDNNVVSFELSTFLSEYKDFITRSHTGTKDGKKVYTKQNLNKVEIYGAELSSTLLLDEAFNAPTGSYFRFNLAYADGEDKQTGNALDSVSPLTAGVSVGLKRENYGADATMRMVARKTDWSEEDNIDAPGYGLLDLTGFYSPVKDLTLRAGLFNALNKKYWSYDELNGDDGTSSFNIDGKSQPGRNWGVSADYQF
ncbi:TonB-dependent hemoglobin/transferrin/lactoferrin family receptor [Vibrio caribbeanicus]|uniref:Heme receptor n=1 Tax=Vibrio caribbeanicus ATCC BAA-2122 TaxID=796620 RepID=E3BKD3_9VIBR|nr:TonB-dependent hemoglobin/transferrin/lactoferrin family receptor [Vibrio caribbeanicus]EFP96518.1 heme receptor [Vibrio caribbeanicus ATCC BAA-2122]